MNCNFSSKKKFNLGSVQPVMPYFYAQVAGKKTGKNFVRNSQGREALLYLENHQEYTGSLTKATVMNNLLNVYIILENRHVYHKILCQIEHRLMFSTPR